MNKFLPHLYEPLRRKIAVSYVQHEMRKLFPDLRDPSLWQSMDKQIESWYEALSERNFWNAVHGITIGFRLISIVPWITSLHVKWEEKNIPIEELWFRGGFGPTAALGNIESVAEFKKTLFLPENSKFVEQTIKYFKERAGETAPRDYFPIFVVRKDGKLRVIDGNGRLLKAIINNKDAILAHVGEPVGEPVLFEHWVPTSLLVDLVFWHKRQIQLGRQTTDIMAQVIAELIRDSSAGRIEFTERAIHHDDEIHMRLLEAVNKILEQKRAD